MYDNIPLIEALARQETTIVAIANREKRPASEIVFEIAHTLWYLGEGDKAIPILREQLAKEQSVKLQIMLLRCVICLDAEDKPQLYEDVRTLQSLLQPRTNKKINHPALQLADRNRMLRIGFACTYSNLKPVELSILPMLRAIDRTRFQIFFFSIGAKGYDALDQICDEHIVLPHDNTDAICQAIEARNIDILFDLNGLLREDYPVDVYARQPARLQAGWWNTPCSSGLDTMQYHFYDGYLLMPEDYKHYTEQIIIIPGMANCCYEFTKEYALTPTPHVKTGTFTFGSFTALFKYNNAVLQTWMEILQKAPHSSLFIKSHCAKTQRFMQRLSRIADEYTVDMQRIIIEDVSTFDSMMEKYADVDLALGTFCYGPGTTAMNAVWQGIPTLAYQGTLPQSRADVGIMLDAGLNAFVVADRDAYIAEAVRLANNPEKLINLRQNLRACLKKDSTYFNPARFARHFEQACLNAWHDWHDKNYAPISSS